MNYVYVALSAGDARLPRVSRRAANRWLKAYTLLHNASTLELTASRLQQKREREAEQRKVGVAKNKRKEEEDAETKEEEMEGVETGQVAGKEGHDEVEEDREEEAAL